MGGERRALLSPGRKKKLISSKRGGVEKVRKSLI